MYTTLIESPGVEPVSVPNMENTQVSNSCKKFLVKFSEKTKFKAVGVSTSSRTDFRKGKKYRKYLS